MAEGAQNHYQVLRIERTADERTIKKAYFTLIREFPPDTHPEEFKAIRAAYEVLSDPVARQRFDNVEKDFGEYGPEIGAELKEIDQLQKSGDVPEVQRRLLALIAQNPELVIAREKLGFSYLGSNAFKEALAQWKELCELRPEEARYHYFRGLALNRLDQIDKALLAIKKAHKLKPEDLGIHLALIDIYRAQRKLPEAMKEIDKASERHEPKSEQALVLALRKADVTLTLGEADDAAREVDRLKKLVREMKDPELPKYVSAQLAAVAARLFARDEPLRANAVLRRCAEIYPESLVDHPYPPLAELDVAALPEAGLEWLSRQTPSKTSPVIAEGIWGLPILSLVAAVAFTAFLFTMAFDDPSTWGAAEVVCMSALLVGITLWLGAALRSILGILRSPLRAFTTLHPLYLLRVRGDRIKIYPLFRLSNIRAVHHHTNGGYTHTAVSLSFQDKVVNLSLRGKDYAQGWVQYLMGSRGRALELMSEGYLEAEHGVELIPPALLSQPSRKKAERREVIRYFGGAAAVGAAVALVTVLWHARAADSYAYRLAVRAQTLKAYSDYLAQHPGGHHVEEAKHHRARIVERAMGELKAASSGEVAGQKALVAALDTLVDAGVTEVPVTMLTDVHEAGDAYLAGVPEPLRIQARYDRAKSLVERLGRTLDGAGLSEVIHLAYEAQAREGAPVKMFIHATISPDGSVLRAEGVTVVTAIKVDWEVTLTKKGAPEPFYRFTTTVEPPDEVELARPVVLSSSGFAATALDAQMDRTYDAFAARFAKELGLPGAARRLALDLSGKEGSAR